MVLRHHNESTCSTDFSKDYDSIKFLVSLSGELITDVYSVVYGYVSASGANSPDKSTKAVVVGSVVLSGANPSSADDDGVLSGIIGKLGTGNHANEDNEEEVEVLDHLKKYLLSPC